jgi:hypothetical protein
MKPLKLNPERAIPAAPLRPSSPAEISSTLPACPQCGRVESVEREGAFDVEGARVIFFSCRTRGNLIQAFGAAPACRINTFAALPSGEILQGVQYLDHDHFDLAKAVEGMKKAATTRLEELTRDSRLTKERRACPNQVCYEFGEVGRKPFCPRCGSATKQLAGLPRLRGHHKVVCSNEKCPAKGKERFRREIEPFCEWCSTKFQVVPFVSRASEIAAGGKIG